MNAIQIQEEKQAADFQIVLLDKKYCPIQKKLVPTGKKISYSANDGNSIWEFYQKHEEMQKAKAGRKKRRNKNKKQEVK